MDRSFLVDHLLQLFDLRFEFRLLLLILRQQLIDLSLKLFYLPLCLIRIGLFLSFIRPGAESPRHSGTPHRFVAVEGGT